MSNSNGLLVGILGVAFVVLKLCHVIDWSWWWVTCPFWGGLAIFLTLMLGVAGVGAIAAGIVGFTVFFKHIFSKK